MLLKFSKGYQYALKPWHWKKTCEQNITNWGHLLLATACQDVETHIQRFLLNHFFYFLVFHYCTLILCFSPHPLPTPNLQGKGEENT